MKMETGVASGGVIDRNGVAFERFEDVAPIQMDVDIGEYLEFDTYASAEEIEIVLACLHVIGLRLGVIDNDKDIEQKVPVGPSVNIRCFA